MPLAYLDSSALVKRYVPEVGSAWVSRLCQEQPVAISLVTIPEVASALARRTREGAFTVPQRDVLFQVFIRDARSLLLIDLNQTIVQDAATALLAAPRPVRLRTLDALHIASAQRAFVLARRRGIAPGDFVTADRALMDAAAWMGLSAANPEDYP